MPQAAKLLEQTLTEEKNTDEALTELADAAINPEAQQAAE
jgi:ferritin-like metal-binding protein YciE